MQGSGVEAGRLRVLVVEDEADIRDSLGELLEAVGFDVMLAQDGVAALQALESVSGLPDVILLDLMMPGMSGEQFRAEQIATPHLAGIPVVLMSAKRGLGEIAVQLGAFAALEKPLNLDRLIDCLRRAASTR